MKYSSFFDFKSFLCGGESCYSHGRLGRSSKRPRAFDTHLNSHRRHLPSHSVLDWIWHSKSSHRPCQSGPFLFLLLERRQHQFVAHIEEVRPGYWLEAAVPHDFWWVIFAPRSCPRSLQVALYQEVVHYQVSFFAKCGSESASLAGEFFCGSIRLLASLSVWPQQLASSLSYGGTPYTLHRKPWCVAYHL